MARLSSTPDPPLNPRSLPSRCRPLGPSRIVIRRAGVAGASVARALARRPLVGDRGRHGGRRIREGLDFLELDWSAGTPLDAISRAGFAMHRELAGELGAERIGYRPTDALMTAAADAEDVERHRRLPNPAWFDGDVVAHEVIGDGVEHAAGAVVLALGPWTDRAQRWLALPQVLGTRMASVVLGADLPARTACPGSLDASPFALTRLPPGRMSAGMGDSAP